MSFLAPALFVGLLALGIPIFLHLVNRERKDVVEFPSLMFIRKIPYRSIRRQRVRHWLLLLVRCLALALIVAAFARPVIEDPPAVAGTVLGAREVVILVDRSYSMGYGDRFEEALDAARGVVTGLGGEDRASLIFFADGADAVARSTTDPGRLRSALDTASVGSGVTRYGPALKLAGIILDESRLTRREAVLITDFQKEGWTGEEDFRLPRGATLTPIPVGEASKGNAMVATVGFQRSLVSGRERVSPTARVVNRSQEPVAELPVTLDIDGREMETQSVSLGPGETESVAFGAFTLSEAFTRGTVRVEADALPADDAFHFVLSPGSALGVLVLEGQREDQSLFLRRALEIGEDPVYQVQVKPAGALAAPDLRGTAVAILNDAPFPSGDRGRALVDFVEAGGGLLVALGERSTFPALAGPVLPGSVGSPWDRDDGRGGTLSFMEYSHPVFELFRTPRSGDFSAARFFRYRPLSIRDEAVEAGAEPTTTVLARYDDGSVALAEKRLGEGRVLVWTSTLDNFWNDLSLQPVFLPFVHQMTRHLAGYREPVPWHTAGQVLSLGGGQELPEGGSEADVAGTPGGTAPRVRGSEAVVSLVSWGEGDRVAETPGGGVVALPPGGEAGFLRLSQHGFWEIRRPGESGESLLTLAVNADRAESDLTTLDPEELASALTAPDAGVPDEGPAESSLSPQDRERRQALWRYLLIAAFALLAAETVVSNRLSRGGRSVREVLSEIGTDGKVGGR